MNNELTPVVSVIMTSYNRGNYISQAIDSVLAQECNFTFEIIIGDDCSTDDSRLILQKYKINYPNVFVIIFNDLNLGCGANWANTLKLARGKYVAFLDDDDYYCDVHRLQSMVDYMNSHPQYGLIHTNYYKLFVETNSLEPSDPKDATGNDQIRGLQNGTYPLCFGTCMIRNELIRKHVQLDVFASLKFPIQDWPTCMLIAPYTQFKYINQLSYVYRKHSGSLSLPEEYETIIRKFTQEKIMNKYVYECLGLNYDELGDDIYRYDILLNLAYKKNDYRNAHVFAKHANRNNIKRWFAITWITFSCFNKIKRLRNYFLKHFKSQ